MTSGVWTNARILTMAAGQGPILQGAVAVLQGRIAWVGAVADLPPDYTDLPVTDCRGQWLLPAFVDCHTHMVFAGTRAREFEMRLDGASYEEIARAGGGIASTVARTAEATEDQLVAQALSRLDALLSEGASTVEIKSGYGLSIEAELRMLRAARRLAGLRPVRITTSWLAAHAVPPAYKGRNAAYIAKVAIPGLTAAHEAGLVDAVDAFCERIAFTPDELRPLFDHARALGLPVKLHAEQLSNSHGAVFAAGYGALSCDHVEYLDAAGIAAMKAAGTTAVLLPGATYAIRETQMPPVEGLRAAGVPIALATDMNPGSSPLASLLLTMNLGATLFRLTVAECLAATTREAARATGLLAETGTIEPGKSADFTLWDIESPAELVYWIGFRPAMTRIFRGETA
ncbi:imidazolonepropionase [Frigidibacter sp. MR17.14]|uniref:imidazolonepropionase n=1 Tax=Frigidibacter sp. MR17.14 TaxID=3126509 RepID=UPI003012C363